MRTRRRISGRASTRSQVKARSSPIWSNVSFMDSSALGVLVRAFKDATGRGVDARVVLPAAPRAGSSRITTLDRVLPIAESPSAALRELRGEPGDRAGEPG